MKQGVLIWKTKKPEPFLNPRQEGYKLIAFQDYY